MKERLVEIIKATPHGMQTLGDVLDSLYIENVMVEHLLENGVIVLPCKVGDEVYLVTPNGKIREINITDIYIEIKPTATVMRLSATFYVDNKPYFFQVSPFDFGKTIFLTREEAQAKLKEGGEE